MTTTHGGRRHGLDEQGPARPLLMRLGADDWARLEALAAAWGCSYAEAMRRALTMAAGGLVEGSEAG